MQGDVYPTLFQKSTGNSVTLNGWRWFKVIWNGFVSLHISLPGIVSFWLLVEFSTPQNNIPLSVTEFSIQIFIQAALFRVKIKKIKVVFSLVHNYWTCTCDQHLWINIQFIYNY